MIVDAFYAVADRNMDGQITEDELILHFRAWGNTEEQARAAFKHLDDMDRFARGAKCRHKALVEYFGQVYDRPNCGACDLCLGDSEEVPDASVVAKKILSCVARVRAGVGIGHGLAVAGQDHLLPLLRKANKFGELRLGVG